MNPRFDLNKQYVKVDNTCKYFGVRLDSKQTLKTHISRVVKKPSKQCGIISKLRHYNPRTKLLNYYNTNVNSIWHTCLRMLQLFFTVSHFSITKGTFEKNTLPKKGGTVAMTC